MTLGTGVYNPQGQFAFPRSYCRGLCVVVDTDLLTFNDNECVFYSYPSHTQEFHIVVAPNLWSWSSNRYTLDYAIAESYYLNLPSPTQNPMPFTLTWFRRVSNGGMYLAFTPFGLGFITQWFHDAPPAPPDYWTHPGL